MNKELHDILSLSFIPLCAGAITALFVLEGFGSVFSSGNNIHYLPIVILIAVLISLYEFHGSKNFENLLQIGVTLPLGFIGFIATSSFMDSQHLISINLNLYVEHLPTSAILFLIFRKQFQSQVIQWSNRWICYSIGFSALGSSLIHYYYQLYNHRGIDAQGIDLLILFGVLPIAMTYIAVKIYEKKILDPI